MCLSKQQPAANDGVNGIELWKSDGTAIGTQIVLNIDPGAADALPRKALSVSGTLYFKAEDVPGNGELWKSDGTANGTVLVKDIHPGATTSGVIPWAAQG